VADTKKVVTIELGGRPRKLRLSLWAQELAEKESGRPFGEMGRWVSDQITILWVAMLEDDPNITRDEVAKMIDTGDADNIGEALDELGDEDDGTPLATENTSDESAGLEPVPSGD